MTRVKKSTLALTTLAGASISSAKIFFQESFSDEGWRQRWTVPSKWKSAGDLGEWGWTTGKVYGDASNMALQTSQDAKFYGLIAPLTEPFTQEKDLVLQYTVKYEQKQDCAGAYIKLLGPEVDVDSFGGDTPYSIMFGPDVCGPSNARTHVIFHSDTSDKNLLIKKDVRMEKDKLSHLYTLHVKADGTFEVYIDQQSVRSGSLEADFDFMEPREIKDPDQSKPEDWVDEKTIPDPDSKKPDGWDDIPATLPDPNAVKPEDWDEVEDGEWEPPAISNPEFKGAWKPAMIPNPDYKGPWVHPMIPNPDFKEEKDLWQRCKKCAHIGFELWQVSAGVVFDDILVTDSLEEAQEVGAKGWASWKAAEKAMYEDQKKKEEDERKAEAADHADGLGDFENLDDATREKFMGNMDLDDEEDEAWAGEL